jgi:hypothetical protein
VLLVASRGEGTQDLVGGVGDVTGNHFFSISLRELEFKSSLFFSINDGKTYFFGFRAEDAVGRGGGTVSRHE